LRELDYIYVVSYVHFCKKIIPIIKILKLFYSMSGKLIVIAKDVSEKASTKMLKRRKRSCCICNLQMQSFISLILFSEVQYSLKFCNNHFCHIFEFLNFFVLMVKKFMSTKIVKLCLNLLYQFSKFFTTKSICDKLQ